MIIAAIFTTATIKSNSQKTILKVSIVVVILLLILSTLIEIIQHFTGRDASITDLFTDVLGIVAGLCVSVSLWAKIRRPLKWGLALTGAVIFLFCFRLPMYYYLADRATPKLPLIANFDSFLSKAKIIKGNADFVIEDHTSFWPSSTNNALSVEFMPARWPYIRITEPTMNWSRYEYVSLDVFNKENTDVRLSIRVDYESIDHPDRSFMTAWRNIPKGHSTVDVSYNELALSHHGDYPNFSRITGLVFYLSNPNSAVTLYFDNIMLR